MTQKQQLDFTRPDHYCDVVLKGGVTSGIVYPTALCELATRYVFKRFGGTSSGAIVAAFGAAAEYFRQQHGADAAVPAEKPAHGLRPGFRGMEDFAEELKTGEKLFAVFQPDAATKPIFDVLFAPHREEARGRRANENRRANASETERRRDARPHDHRDDMQPMVRTMVTFWSYVPQLLPRLGGLMAFAAIATLGWPQLHRIELMAHASWQQRVLGDALALLCLVVLVGGTLFGFAVGGAISAFLLVQRKWIPTFVANGFGLTRGLSSAIERSKTPARDIDGAEPYSLTTWMTRIINELAGRSPIDAPLTLGDLWTAGSGSAAKPTITFETITTCLTLGRPFRLPNDRRNDPPLYFDPDEWREYFPERVVKWLKDNARGRPRFRDPTRQAGPVYYRLPRADKLPVVVVTRLSVALPGVLSAVPLWSVDFNTRGARRSPDIPLQRAWFSDGGVGSNFPIHFFDALIPDHPTFGIDLRDANHAYPIVGDESQNVWMPLTNDHGRTEWWTHFATDSMETGTMSPSAAMKAVMQFGASVVSTALTWRDTTLAREAGFRDRIAHIKIDSENEGGLNLDMPQPVIERLLGRGAAAGALLRERYTKTQEQLKEENDARRAALSPEELKLWRPTTVSWENHQWVRFRASMAALQESLEQMNATYTSGPAYQNLINRPSGDPPTDFAWSDTQRFSNPLVKTEALLAALEVWRTTPAIRFNAGRLPLLRPELRMSPRV